MSIRIEIFGLRGGPCGSTCRPRKTRALLRFEVPKNVNSMSSFIVPVSCYRRFIKDFAEASQRINEEESKVQLDRGI